MKRFVLPIFSLLITMSAITGCNEKELTDRDVLMLIFNNNNGENWTEYAKKNWGSELPLKDWNGVNTDENGRVTVLNIGNDSITGAFPEEIGLLTELKSLTLRTGRKLSKEQPFPATISNMTNLESLTLTGNMPDKVELQVPPVGKLVNLKKIYYGGENRAPQGLENLTGLVEIEFMGLLGDIPACLSKMTNLEKINIRGNAFTGKIPSDINNLKKLKSLFIDKSQFIGSVEGLSGTFPESIWELENLDYIFLRNISSDGTLSPKIANLKKLTSITIIDCGLTGEIPKELYNMEKLRSLSIYQNKLTGIIAPEIGNLTALTDINLHHNNLTGSLPATLGKLSKLKSLQVQKNLLTGDIPAELANCPLDGVFVDFSGNQFSKDIAPALKAHPRFEKMKF
jgi:Leucine-rich repeat (LRR) protein